MSHDMPSHDGTDRTARNRRRTFAAVRYRRRLLSRLLLAGIVAAMTATAAWYATTSPKSALATILHPAELVNTNSKLCMGTTGGRLGIGAPVIQFHCTKHFDQAWEMQWAPGSSLPDPDPQTGFIFNRGAPNRCLGTPDGSTENGAKIILKACNKAYTDEIWTPVRATTFGYAGGYVLQNYKTNSERCLGVPGGDTSENVQLVLWDCNNAADQVWQRGDEFDLTQSAAGRETGGEAGGAVGRSGESGGQAGEPAGEAAGAVGRHGEANSGAYPQISDPSGYRFTDREFMFSGVSPQQVQDMVDHKVPLGVTAAQWNDAMADLGKALTAAQIPDADIRLKGSSTRYFTYDLKTKSFPQTVDEVKQRVLAAHPTDPNKAQLADQAAHRYLAAGFGTTPLPKHSFFDSLAKLDIGQPSDYDLQLVSQNLADRFEEYIKENPTEPVFGDDDGHPDLDPSVSPHGGHYKSRYLEFVAKPLFDWTQRWGSTLGRDVTIATFAPDKAPPQRDTDWPLVKP